MPGSLPGSPVGMCPTTIGGNGPQLRFPLIYPIIWSYFQLILHQSPRKLDTILGVQNCGSESEALGALVGRPPGNQVSPDAQAVTHHLVPDPEGAGKWPGGALVQGLGRGRLPGCRRTSHGPRPARGPFPTAVTLTRQFPLLSLCCPNQTF